MVIRTILICLLTPFFVLAIGTLSAPVEAGKLAESIDTQAPLAVPATPNLSLPADGTTTTGVTHPPLGVPTLSWAKTSGAEKYRIAISTSAGFADPVVEQITYTTMYTPESALADGEYYWRVQAGMGVEWGEYSEVRTFIKEWDAGGELLPRLLSPVDENRKTTFTKDDFSWTSMPGAAGYLLEIATDDTFSTVSYSAKTTTTSHTPTTHLNNNLYHWRVTSYDNRDNFSRPSATFTFTFDWNLAPALLAPEDDVDLFYSPTLSWTAVEGAKKYMLEIDTEDDFPSPQACTCYTTNFTWYKNLSNDQEYFWRVKAVDNAGNSAPWSPVRRFRIKWEFEPPLLTPNNNVIYQAAPYFSWEPIPNAERYQFQVDESTSFEIPKTDLKIYNATHAGITAIRDTITYVDRDYYWRVRGIDAQNNYSPWTEIHSFRFGFETSPNLVYPQAYYEPDLDNLPVARDETISHPLFVWDTAHKWDPFPHYAKNADFYEVTAAADPAFGAIHFQVETASLAAAPTLAHPFNTLADGELVYWRVRAFVNSTNNSAAPTQIGADSAWITRIDTTYTPLPSTDVISTIYPADGFTTVDIPPVLGWLPTQGAAHYHLQISRNSDFTALVEDVQPQFTNYVPGLGQRNKFGYGTFWWRVRAQNAAGDPITEWSDIHHFNTAVELLNGNQYDLTPAPYPNTIFSDTLLLKKDEITQLYRGDWTRIASDADDGLSNGELTTLHAMLNRIDLRAGALYPKADDNYNWVFAFAADLTTDSAVYVLYVDTDHIVGSGGTSDPYSADIRADELYLPEHVLYIKPSTNAFTPADVELFSWTGAAWAPVQNLSAIGGDAWYSPEDKALQALVPYTALGPGEENWSGSLAIALYSIDNTTNGAILDALPDPIVAANLAQMGTLNNPIFISDMLTPLYPFDMPLTDPIVFEDMPTLRWRTPPFGSIDGYQVEVARDQQFTDIVETWGIHESSMGEYFAMLTSTFQSTNAYEDNESYYWRVRLRHERYSGRTSDFDYSPWSPAMRFRLTSRTIGNPRVSTGELADTTPYFTWDRVDGASGYRIEIDDDLNFSDPEFAQDVDSNAYGSVGAMWDGTWYWRVAIRRSKKVRGEWSPTMTFTKRSLAPTPLSPIDEVVINQQPTFQWTAILTPTTLPRVSAPSYRLEVDDDPNFSNPTVYKTDLTSYTLDPRKNLADGTWYWRVAMVDSAGNIGTYSAGQTFYKEYLPPTLVAPVQGSRVSSVADFQWDAVPGAAYYEFEYADNILFNLSKKIQTDNAQYTPTARTSAQEYFWRVRIYDDIRNPGPFAGGRVELIQNDVYLPYWSQ